MPEIVLFGEDYAHEVVLKALIHRLADRLGVKVGITTRNVRGGAGRALSEVEEYLKELSAGIERLPDLLIVAIDANCVGIREKLSQLRKRVPRELKELVIFAVPDPHIERWLLLDSRAFKTVLGTGCEAPTMKCERAYYKSLLDGAVRGADVIPLLGGIEYAENIILEMDLSRVAKKDKSLKYTLQAINRCLAALKR